MYGEINWYPFDRSDGQETFLQTKLRKKNTCLVIMVSVAGRLQYIVLAAYKIIMNY